MITGIKKMYKTTEIYFDEADKWTTVITYNTSLKNRLLTFSQKHTELCEMFSDDECRCLSFRIDKKCFTYRLNRIQMNERQRRERRCRS